MNAVAKTQVDRGRLLLALLLVNIAALVISG